jgi:hypothetical protein
MKNKIADKQWYDYKTFYPLVACGESMINTIEKEDAEVLGLLGVVRNKEHFPYIYIDEDIHKLNDYLDSKHYDVKYYECNGFDDTVWVFPLPSNKEYKKSRDLFIEQVEEQLAVGTGNCLDWIVRGNKPSGY